MTVIDTAPWIVWTIVLPLISAPLAFLLERRAVWLLGPLTVLGVLASVGGLSRQILSQGTLDYAMAGWDPPLGIALHADGLSALMLLMTAVVGAAVSVYAAGYFSEEPGRDASGRAAPNRPRLYFWPLWFFLWGSLNALFLAADIFNIYVALELLGLSAVALVALEGSLAALTAALRYLLVSLVGSLFYLLGVALLYSAYATVDMQLLSERIEQGPIAWSAAALMIIALLMKTALFPLHFWLPPAHGNAPAPVSALLSALVVKASFYLTVRLWFAVFPAVFTAPAGRMLGALGAMAILWGSVQALRQQRLKLLVAYSTVAQLGYLFLLFPLAAGPAGEWSAWSGGAYFALSHACAKASLFMVAGTILHALGHDRIADLEGTVRRLPVSLFAFALAGVSLMGLPISGGFVAKWLLLSAAVENGQWWWTVVILAGGLMAAGYVFRVLRYAFSNAPLEIARPPALRLMEWSSLSLAMAAVLLGLMAVQPLALLQIGAPFDPD